MKKRSLIVFCTIGLTAALLLSGCSKKESVSQNSNDKEKTIALSAEKNKLVNLNLYFDSSRDSNIAAIAMEQRAYNYDELLGEFVIQEFIKGPSIKLNMNQLLPKETRLLSFSIKDNIAYVNLSKEANVPLLPAKEEALIQSMVLSLTEIPAILKVKIFIEGNDVNLWGGTRDLTKPLGRNDFNNTAK